MSEPVKIICPLCYSPHISMYMQGLNSNTSGTMGMPAGNVANNNMELKCNACSHVFKPAEGKLSQEPEVDGNVYGVPAATGAQRPLQGPDPEEVLSIVQTHGKLNAIKFVKDNTNWSLKESKDYVDSLDGSRLIPGQKKACFIATACYGDYDAPEVVRLRLYRDEVLARSLAGKTFIEVYYKLSPPLARWLSQRPRYQAWVRRYLLAPLLHRMDRL